MCICMYICMCFIIFLIIRLPAIMFETQSFSCSSKDSNEVSQGMSDMSSTIQFSNSLMKGLNLRHKKLFFICNII